MQVRPGSSRPAIELFNSGVARGDTARHAEMADFERMRIAKQGAGVDRAIREGLSAPPADAPAPVPAAAPASKYISVSPDTGGDTEIGELVREVRTPQPAITSYQASGPSPLMSRLSQTPGAGSTMLTMHREDQRTRSSAETQAIRALHNGEPEVAESLSTRYGLNIPAEAIRNAGFQRSMKNLGALIKQNGINDDATAVQITRNFLDAIDQGADERSAYTVAFQKVKAPAKAPRRTYDQVRGVFVEEPTDETPSGRVMTPPALPPRQVGGRGGPGGGKTATERNLAARLKLLIEGGVPEADAKRIVGGAGKPPTVSDAGRIAARLWATDQQEINPTERKYKTYQDAVTAAKAALGITAAGVAGSTGPTRIRYDAQGNRLP